MGGRITISNLHKALNVGGNYHDSLILVNLDSKEYHIKIYSISRLIISFLLIQGIAIALFADYIADLENRLLSTFIIIVFFITTFYLSSLIGQAKIKLVFTKDALLHIWERRFLFSWEKDVTIPWTTVDNYVFEKDRTWDSFIINLSTKMRYKIDRLNIIPITDDFDKFKKDFPQLSNKLKKEIKIDSNSNLKLIEEGKNKYANKSFRQSLYILSIAFFILCIVKVINSGKLTSLWSLGVIGSAIAYYWSMLKTNNK